MNAKRITLVITIAVICLAAVLGFRVKPKQALGQEYKNTPVGVIQLPSEGGVVPVEIQRAKVSLSQPNAVSGYSCAVKNNSAKNITALALEWTFTSDENGKSSAYSDFSEMDAIVHPDIQDYGKTRAVAPGNEITMDSNSGLSVKPPARIVKADVILKYVEFDGKSVIDLDPRHDSSTRINEMREGAEKCKQWLSQAYKQKGGDLKSLLPVLQSGSFPSELNLSTHPQHNGATRYANFILSLYADNQQEALKKYLGK